MVKAEKLQTAPNTPVERDVWRIAAQLGNIVHPAKVGIQHKNTLQLQSPMYFLGFQGVFIP